MVPRLPAMAHPFILLGRFSKSSKRKTKIRAVSHSEAYKMQAGVFVQMVRSVQIGDNAPILERGKKELKKKLRTRAP